MSYQILRLNEVISRTGLSRSTIYKLMANSTFPDSKKLTSRSVGWEEDAIDRWIDQLPKRSNTSPRGRR